jgi:hypothetical protein
MLPRLVSARTPVRPVAIVRMIVGVDALFRGLAAAVVLERVLQPDTLHLPYQHWLPVLSYAHIRPYTILWLIAAIAFAIGWRTTFSGVLLAALIGYSILVDQQTYSNHLYLMTIIVLLLVPAHAGGALSIDAWLGRRASDVPYWPVFLLKAQVSIIYAFSALAKLNPSYLSGDVLVGFLRDSGPLHIPLAYQTSTMGTILAAGSIAGELFLAVALWSTRWRRMALAVGVMMHVSMVVILSAGAAYQIATFGIETLALYILFFRSFPIKAHEQEIPTIPNQLAAV